MEGNAKTVTQSDISAIRNAAIPLLPHLPEAGWLPHALVRKPDGKLDKPPRGNATSNNPASWYTLDGALRKLIEQNDVAGVAFAITKGLISLDFDDCRDPYTGELAEEVERVLEQCQSYAYVTPSRTGIRIVGINSTENPIPGKKVNRWLPGGHKIELFIGPVNFYNTFTADIIPGYNTIRDISTETIEYLTYLDGGREATNGATPPVSNPDPQRSTAAIRAALAVIPNTAKNWDEWNRIGMAVWRSCGGRGDGLDAWHEWSAKNPCDGGTDNCDDRWQHYFESPPTKIGFGTLYHEARKARPLFVPPFDPVPLANGHDPEPEKKPGTPDIPLILTMRQLDAMPPPEWLIQGLVPEMSLVVPFGPPKSGKTFVVLSMALHIAAGIPWFGYAAKQGAVVYIAGEGTGGLSARLRAMRAAYKIDIDVPFFVIRRAVNFRNHAEVEALAGLIRDTTGDVPLRLVVIDTLARAMPGADENSAQEVGLVVAECDWLRDTLNTATMPIHHSGKDETRGARGTSALRGAWDAAFEIRSSGKRRTVLTVVDQKEAEAGQRLVFRMDEIPCGIGRTSLVPMLDQEEPEDERTERTQSTPGGQPGIALQVLRDALGGPDGAIVPRFSGKPEADLTGLHIETWRRKFYERMPSMPQDTRKKAFQRAFDKLTKDRLIGAHDPWVWLG